MKTAQMHRFIANAKEAIEEIFGIADDTGDLYSAKREALNEIIEYAKGKLKEHESL